MADVSFSQPSKQIQTPPNQSQTIISSTKSSISEEATPQVFKTDQIQEPIKGGDAPLVSLVETNPGVPFAELAKTAIRQEHEDGNLQVIEAMFKPIFQEHANCVEISQKQLKELDKQQLKSLEADMQGFQKSTFAQKISQGGLKQTATKQFGDFDFLVYNLIQKSHTQGDLAPYLALVEKAIQRQPLSPQETKTLHSIGILYDPKSGLETTTVDPRFKGQNMFVGVLLNNSQINALVSQIKLINNASPELRTYLKEQAKLLEATGDLEKLQRATEKLLESLSETTENLQQTNHDVVKLQGRIKALSVEMNDYIGWVDKYAQAMIQLNMALQSQPPQLEKLSAEAIALIESLGYRVDVANHQISLEGVSGAEAQLSEELMAKTQHLQSTIDGYETQLLTLKQELSQASARQDELLAELDVLNEKRQASVVKLEESQRQQVVQEEKVTQTWQQLKPSEQAETRAQYEQVLNRSQVAKQVTPALVRQLVAFEPIVLQLRQEVLTTKHETQRLLVMLLPKPQVKHEKIWADLNETLRLLNKRYPKSKTTPIAAQHQASVPADLKKSHGEYGHLTAEEQEAKALLKQDQQKQKQTKQQQERFQTQQMRMSYEQKERAQLLQAERHEKQQLLERRWGIRE